MNPERDSDTIQHSRTPTQARQGVRSFASRVLVVSLYLVIVVFVVLYLIWKEVDADRAPAAETTGQVVTAPGDSP